MIHAPRTFLNQILPGDPGGKNAGRDNRETPSVNLNAKMLCRDRLRDRRKRDSLILTASSARNSDTRKRS
jgi:hypothetical protein